MFIYILMLFISLLFCFLFSKIKNCFLKVIMAILSFLPFFLVSGFRYDVGTDYMYRYVTDFNLFLYGYDVSNLEIGFKLLIKFCLLLTDHYQLLFIITSLLINVFVFYAIFTSSKNKYLSIVLYFVGAFFFQSLNMTRQYISICLLLVSYRSYLRENYILLFLLHCFAFLFHSTSIICSFIFLVFILVDKIFSKNIILSEKIIIPFTVLLLFATPVIRLGINFVLSFTRFSVYMGSKFDYGDLQIIPFAINMLVYLGMIYIKNKKVKLNREEVFFINVQAIAVVIIALGNTTYLAIRLLYYFSIFQILSIPHFVGKLRNFFKDKRLAYLVNVFIILVFSCSLLWTHVLHTSDEVLPYKTIINKELEFR